MSEHRAIARAAAVVALFTLCSRVTGLIRDAVIGYVFGTGLVADSFFVAFRIPNLLRRFVAEGAMSVAFIPVFTETLETRGRNETLRTARILMTVMGLGLAVLTLFAIVFAPAWVGWFAPGFADEPGKLELTAGLTRVLLPYVFLVSLVALASGLLNSLRHFATPAISPIVLNLAMIAAVLLLCPRLASPIYGLAYGVIAGGVLQLVVQLPPLLRRGMRLWPLWEPRHPAVARSLGLMAPTLFGAAVYQINLMIATMLASALPEGSVSYLWYADRVFEFPLGLFAVSMGTAALPSFAAQAARGAMGEMKSSLGFAIRMTNLIALPAAVGLITLATPIVAVLFRRGAFEPDQVRMTAWALQAFALGLWPVSIVRILVPAFYAIGDTRTPVLAAAAAFLGNVLFSLMLIGNIDPAPGSAPIEIMAAAARVFTVFDLGHAGLAAATSAAAAVNFVYLAVALHLRLERLRLRPLVRSLAVGLAASAMMVPAVNAVAGQTDWMEPGRLGVKIGVLVLAMSAGIVVYGLAACMLGSRQDLAELARLFTARRRTGTRNGGSSAG